LAGLRWQSHSQLLAGLSDRLRLLSPEQVLARGYSITRDEVTGAIIRCADQTQPEQALRTRLQHGEIRSVVAKPAGG